MIEKLKQYRSDHPVLFRIIFIPLSPLIFAILFIAMALAIIFFMLVTTALWITSRKIAREVIPPVIHELSMKLRGK